jgi:hypothetical protein
MAADCCCNLLGLFARVSGLAVFTAAKTRALFCVANCMHTTHGTVLKRTKPLIPAWGDKKGQVKFRKILFLKARKSPP